MNPSESKRFHDLSSSAFSTWESSIIDKNDAMFSSNCNRNFLFSFLSQNTETQTRIWKKILMAILNFVDWAYKSNKKPFVFVIDWSFKIEVKGINWSFFRKKEYPPRGKSGFWRFLGTVRHRRNRQEPSGTVRNRRNCQEPQELSGTARKRQDP
jgi:hypothetical protein